MSALMVEDPRFNRFVDRAHKILCAVHAFLWCIVLVVWIVAWRTVHAPVHPEFITAKHFIGAVDVLVYLNVDELSLRMAARAANWFNADLGLAYILLFSSGMLFAGSLQWFLIGRFIQWTSAKYGQWFAKLFTAFVSIWIVYFALLWLAWWWL